MPEGFYFLISEEKDISYCSCDLQSHTVKNIGILQLDLLDEINDWIARSDFHSLTCIFETSAFSIIPSVLFDETSVYDYLKLSCRLDENAVVRYDSVDSAGMVNAYAVPANYYDFISRISVAKLIRHHTSVLLDAFLGFGSDNVINILINKGKGKSDIIVVKGSALLLCERFNTAVSGELVYHILNVVQQLGLDKEHVKLFLSGSFENGKTGMQSLSSFFRHCEYVTLHNLLTLPDGVSFHHHYNLLSAISCV